MDETNTTSGWSSRRKVIYLWSTILFLTLVSFTLFWNYWYKAPTCSDGFKNGDETGIDCGGSCSLICSAESLQPIMRSDPRVFEVYPGVYSVVAYVENQNVDGRATNVPYKFTLYDDAGKVIYEREGKTSLLRNSVTAIFEGNINIKDKKPVRVTFDLSTNIYWIKDNREYPEISITHSAILNGDVSPRIEATVENKSIEDVKNMEIVASIYDGKDNVVAVSRTMVELLRKGEKTGVFFTWPIPFSLSSNPCEKPSITELLIDRSGSMVSISKDPPEPLNSVKEAAKYFTSLLKPGDKVGLISFASKASAPADIAITTDVGAVEKAIDNISILKDGTQYTNIFDAVNSALTDLSLGSGLNGDSEGKKVMILLTDGVANRPQNPADKKPTEQSDMAYAESEALRIAGEAKKDGIELFAIGLGKDVHKEFLDQLASSPDDSYIAPATSDLKNIYKSISSSICKEVPARIEMNYKFND